MGMDNLHMDDLMTETQEPEPGYDLDDEQRPRLSRVSHSSELHVRQGLQLAQV